MSLIMNPYRFVAPTGVDFKVGSFIKTPTEPAPVDQAVTGVGFKPKVVIFFTDINVVSDTISVHSQLFAGFSDGTNDKSIAAVSQNGLTGVSICKRYSASAKCIHTTAQNGTVLDEASIKTFDSDGFTLTWSALQTGGQARIIKYIAIAGDGITDVEVGSFTTSNSMGTQNVSTGVANADFLMLLNGSANVEDTLINHAIFGIGVATSASARGGSGTSSKNGMATSVTDRYQRTNNIITSPFDSAKFEEADFDGFTGSGFDLDWTVVAGVREIYYLTIKGGSWEVGSGTSPASTTPQTKAYTTTFEPKGVAMWGFLGTAGTTILAQQYFHMGASDGTTNVGIAVQDRDGVSTTICDRISSSTKCVTMIAGNPTAAVIEDADLDSFNATDFTLDWTTTTLTDREFIWFVVGD